MKKVFGSPPSIRNSSRRPKSSLAQQKLCAISRENGDRYIAQRSSVDADVARYLAREKINENNTIGDGLASKEAYNRELAATLFKDSDKSRILRFSSKPYDNVRNLQSFLSEVASPGPRTKSKKLPGRYIPQVSERTLDAPDLVDDYYLNVLDWSVNNILAIALGNTVFLWDAITKTGSELLSVDDNVGPITSVNWAPDGIHIAVGCTSSDVELWNSASKRQLRTLKGHHARVVSLAWNNNMLTTGGLDCSILNHDVRIRESIVQTYNAHKDEVCGLKWSQSGQQLASGGNDNLVHIWDLNMSSYTQYLHRLDEHCAAVKALAWCPFRINLLASGGGSSDRRIKFWNTLTGACLNTIDTNSPVSALLWNKHEHEILSSHGHSQNQLTLWKYPSMVKMADLTGHTSRVLHMAQSPDGYTVASAAADETLMLWQVFGDPDTSRTKSKETNVYLNKYLMQIR